MLPILSALSKTFQTGSLNFSRITPLINKSKEKIKEVANDGRVLTQLKGGLNGRLKGLTMTLTETQEALIEKFVNKYATSICESITARFPKDSCEVLEAFSIFDVFSIHGENEVNILAKQFSHRNLLKVSSQSGRTSSMNFWKLRKSIYYLKKKLNANKLKFKKTSSEWTLEHILNAYQGEVEFPSFVQFAKIATIVPVTNTWPERGTSAVKTRTRSSMKTDLLNGLLHITINGSPVNSKEADNLMRVVDKYVNQRHYKAPTIYTAITTTSSSSTQTETVEVNEEIEIEEDIDILINDCVGEFMTTNFEDGQTSSEEEYEDDE